jgi:hypothetical protein
LKNWKICSPVRSSPAGNPGWNRDPWAFPRASHPAIVGFWNEHGTPKIVYRASAEIARFFDGLDLLTPGVVPCSRWRPAPGDPDIDVNQYAGVGRKA